MPRGRGRRRRQPAVQRVLRNARRVNVEQENLALPRQGRERNRRENVQGDERRRLPGDNPAPPRERSRRVNEQGDDRARDQPLQNRREEIRQANAEQGDPAQHDENQEVGARPARVRGRKRTADELDDMVDERLLDSNADTFCITLAFAAAAFAVLVFIANPQDFYLSVILVGGILLMLYQLHRRRKTTKNDEKTETFKEDTLTKMSEKEYGSFGPAVDAATFFENPVYYEDGIDTVPSKEYSRYVSELMDGLGYSYEMIKYRQQMVTEADNLANRHETFDGTMVTTGGTGEGTALYRESDIDLMFIINEIVCTNNPQDFNNQENITLFQTETLSASPGYTRLKLLRFDGKFFQKEISSSLFKSESGSDYLSSEFFIDAVKEISRQESLDMKLTIQPKSGPSAPTSNKYLSYDNVYCFRCFCPNILERWKSRPRSKGWPSSETVHEVSLLDGHVVPVGFKDSQNMNIEWRICYSLAELHLMRNLNEAQIKVYILLKKISKSALNKVCEDMTSYIMKNIILWECEAKGLGGFTKELIMDRLCNCLQSLKKCVSESKLQSYMIPERNLLAGRIDIPQKQKLISVLNDLLKERGMMFFRCDKLRDAMIMMYKTPNMFREFSEKRDKVERLMLVNLSIKSEVFRPGMSVEELDHLLRQNKKFCDMQTQISHLIQFNTQELRQMGKTDAEINDLWQTKLSQLLS